LLLFPLFALPLNCPYPDPPVFCLFLHILLHTPAGQGGRPRGAFVAGQSQTITVVKNMAGDKINKTIGAVAYNSYADLAA